MLFKKERVEILEELIWELWDDIIMLNNKVEILENENKSGILGRCERDKQHEHVERNSKKKFTLWT